MPQRSVHRKPALSLKLVSALPLLMTGLWLILALCIYAAATAGGDEYREVLRQIHQQPKTYAAPSPPPPLSTVVQSSPTAQPEKSLGSSAPPLPPPAKPARLDYPEPPPAVWELQSVELKSDQPDYFELRFRYHGGRPMAKITYEPRRNPVWIIDIPGQWKSSLAANYHWPEGLVSRLAVGLHSGYLRLVLYLRQPHGGRQQMPVIMPLDTNSFSLSLRGAKPEQAGQP